jgi:hypothetical protein
MSGLILGSSSQKTLLKQQTDLREADDLPPQEATDPEVLLTLLNAGEWENKKGNLGKYS